MRPRAAVLIMLAMALAPLPAHAQGEVEEPTVRRAIEDVLELDTGRQAARLPRVTLDIVTGDLTVVFAMRRPLSDNAAQIVASATDDVFTILWAAYASQASAHIRTTTVLGTYALVGRYERPREIPLIRAVLSADRAAQMDWTSVASVDPREVLDVWWTEGDLAR
jgi:hypothetical protein